MTRLQTAPRSRRTQPHFPTPASNRLRSPAMPSSRGASALGDQIRAQVDQLLADAFTPASRRPPPVNLSPVTPPPVTTAPVTPVDSGDRPDPIAPGSSTDLYDTDAASLIDAPLTSTSADRSAEEYDAVIDQFAVETNPRYAQRNGNTYCNIFASDVTRAMGAEIPHWVDASGKPVGQGMGTELDANATNAWLNQHGSEYGWRQVSAEEAQAMANEGHPVVASWANWGGIGHIGVVRPGDMQNGPALAQAGAQNVNDAHVYDIFPRNGTEFWAHA
ncbi:MAG: hypothetical protein JNK82_25365 [Myxococcaceae bacterium]|nr:hypothetical protein [Myxococcaceae bacterium]